MRLGEARVGHRDGDAARGEVVGRLQAVGQPRAERETGHAALAAGLAHHPALADRAAPRLPSGDPRRRPRREDSAGRWGRCRAPAAVATMWTSSASSAAAISTMFGSAAEVGDVEGAGMGGAVRAHQPRAVQHEAHRQVLQRDVVDHLVVGALQEGGVDGAERLDSPRVARPAAKRHGVLLGDADVEGALGEGLRRTGPRPVPAGMAAVMADAPCRPCAPAAQQALAEDAGIGGRVGLGLGLRPGDHVEGGDAVILVGGGLGGRVALALLRTDMHEDRAPFPRRAHCAARAAGAPDCGRRWGRHSRSRARRTACRR